MKLVFHVNNYIFVILNQHLMNKNYFLILFCLLLFSSGKTFAQCASTTQYPSTALTPTIAWSDIDACNLSGDYAVINVVSGNIYQFSTLPDNGTSIPIYYDSELTLTTNANVVLAYNDDYSPLTSYSQITWTATFSGTVRIHLTEYQCSAINIFDCINISYRVIQAASAPGNNNCANATNLTPSSSCVSVNGTTAGATEEAISDPSCDPGTINDVWYTFNSGNYTSLNLNVTLGSASWVGVELFTSCGTLAQNTTIDGNAGNCDFNTSVPNPTVLGGLTPNTNYRFRLFTNIDFDTPGSFTTCLTTPPPPTVSVNSPTICAGQSVTLTATPSVSGGTYLWSPGGATTQSITVSPTTTSNYTVTYTYNGSNNGSGTVTVNSLPAINAGQDVTICQGASSTLTATGGSTYVWTGGPSTANYSVSPSLTTTYTVTGTNTTTGCSNIDQVNVNVTPLPTVNAINNQTLCAGSSTMLVSFSGTTNASYTWTNNNTSIGLAASGSGNIPVFTATNSTSNPITATITVTPTLSGCNGTSQTFTYTVNPTPSVSAPANQSACAGTSTNTVTFSGTSGASYSWTNSNTNIGLASSGTGNINSFTATNTSTSPITSSVIVTPTLGNCTGPTQTFSFTVNPLPTISGNSVLCPSTTSQLSGSGTAAFNNAWVSSNNSIATVSNTGLVNALSFGNAIITYTNSLGCSNTTTINVTNPTTPTFNPISAVCAGGLIQLPTSSTNNIQGTWSPTVNNTQTTTYNFTPLSGQCATTAQLTVSVNQNPTITGTNNICVTGTVQLNGSGTAATNNAWISSNQAIASVSNTGLVTGSTSGSVNITYTNNNGCTNTASIMVNPNPTANAGQDITLCSGGSLTLTGSGTGGATPYTYSWNNGIQNGVAFSPTVNISYTLVVTDANGCSNSDAMNLTLNTINWANLQTPSSATICLGQVTNVYGQVYVSGVTPNPGQAAGINSQVGVSNSNTDPSTWPSTAWSNTTYNSQSGNNDEYVAGIGQLLSAGTYYYTFRYSLGQGCPYYYGGFNNGFWDGTSNINGTITINGAPSSSSTISACGSYSWYGQNYSQSGTFVHTTPSSSGCDSVHYLNLTILGPINGTTEQISACSSYQWHGLTYTQSGQYSQTLQTSLGCDSIVHLNLTIHNPYTGSSTQVNACNSYEWNGQIYSQSGTYTFNGTTQFGCDSTATLVLIINQGPTNTNLTDNGWTISASSQNATTYSWLDCNTNSIISGETAQTFTPTVSGSYAVIVGNACGTDTSNCINFAVEGLKEFDNFNVVAFPNPTNDFITLSGSEIWLESVYLFDISGKMLKEVIVNGNKGIVDITEFSDGIYLMKIISDNKSKLIQIIKN